jgi:DnaJ-class molecular chaperone
MVQEPIAKCSRCRGEGILDGAVGKVACSTCNGAGLRARHPREVTIKICGCGADFTRRQWKRLPHAGEMADGLGGVLELRNCACGSTIAIQLRSVA